MYGFEAEGFGQKNIGYNFKKLWFYHYIHFIQPHYNALFNITRSCHGSHIDYFTLSFLMNEYKFPMLNSHMPEGENSCYHPAIISTITCA